MRAADERVPLPGAAARLPVRKGQAHHRHAQSEGAVHQLEHAAGGADGQQGAGRCPVPCQGSVAAAADIRSV